MKEFNRPRRRDLRRLGYVCLAWVYVMVLPACGSGVGPGKGSSATGPHSGATSSTSGAGPGSGGAGVGSGGSGAGTGGASAGTATGGAAAGTGGAGSGAGSGGAGGAGGGAGGAGGCTNPVALYTDQDGDGYSLERPGSPVPTCLNGPIPPGHTTTTKGWDCDDTNPQLTTHCPSKLVADINQVSGTNPSSSPHAIALGPGMGLLGNHSVFFAATDPRNGTELWTTDSTGANTKLVVDLFPGPTSSNPTLITAATGTTYFVATTPEYGTELWKTDGTTAGTALVADLVPGPGSSTISAAVSIGSRLYFVAQTTGSTVDLWQTDGTAASTVKVNLGTLTGPVRLTPVGTSLFLFAGASGARALFRVDPSGPTRLYPAGTGTADLTQLTAIGNAAYYVDGGLDIHKANTNGDALFYSMQSEMSALAKASDCQKGTGKIEHLASPDGTHVVFDLHANLSASQGNCSLSTYSVGQDLWYVATASAAPAQLSGFSGINTSDLDEQRASHVVTYDGNVYFVVWTCPWNSGTCESSGAAAEEQGPKTLWSFDGSSASKVLTLDAGAYFDMLTPVKGGIYWVGPAGVSSGKPTGMQGDALWYGGAPTAATAANGWTSISPIQSSGGIFLAANSGAQGALAYLAAGSTMPTVLASPLAADPSNALIVPMIFGLNVVDHIVIAGDDGATGAEPWTSDGTLAGTQRLADINTDPGSSSPAGFTELSGKVLFSAGDGVTGTELWRSDGTGMGTVQIKDIWSGTNGSDPASLAAINGVLYFSANDGYTGTQFWSSKGTVGDPVMVTDIFGGFTMGPNPMPNSSNPGPFTSFLGDVFFPATQGPSTNVELFRYAGNGSPGPATMVTKINPSTMNGSYPRSLTVAGGKLFFIADDGTHGEQLWVTTDGTATGTTMVMQPNQPTDALKGSELVAFGQRVFYAASDTVNGRELWASDGTLGGTFLVDEINPNGSSNPDSLAVVGGTLYFAATDGNGDRELWSKTGTAAAARVADINATGSSNPDTLTAAGSLLFFAADDGTHGRELCVTSGTAASTTCFDIWPGPLGSAVGSIVTVDSGRVVFSASDGVHGVELWQSDGTPTGTVMVDDIAPGTSSSNPAALVWSPALFRVFFQADDGKKGVELRTISLPSLGP